MTITEGIVTGFLHSFTVSAVNGRGEGPQSNEIQVYAATTSLAPVNLRRKEADGTHVSI